MGYLYANPLVRVEWRDGRQDVKGMDLLKTDEARRLRAACVVERVEPRHRELGGRSGFGSYLEKRMS